MEIKTSSTNNNDSFDEYFIPFEPNHALALTMNFPQFPETIQSKSSDVQADFDYNCSDCMADLFGPIMAPYAALQQQTDDYRRRLEHIAHRRYMAMKSHLFEQDFERKWKRTFKHPFKYDISAFLPRMAILGRLITMMISGWTFIIGLGLLIFGMYLILVSDQRQPMLTFIRTFSKFYKTFFFQGVIGYLILYSILLIVAALCSLLGVLLCSFILTLLGIVSILMAFALAIVLPIILNIRKISLVEKLERYMRASIKDYDDIPENPVTIFWNVLQEKYSCCGLHDSIEDYRDSYFQKLTGQSVPQSCCRDGFICTNSPTITNSFLDDSCLPQAKRFLDLAILITTIGHIILIIVLLITLISATCFFFHINSAKQALDKHNEFIIKSMLSILKQDEKELGDFKKSVSNETNMRDKQRIQGILPITPTVVRIKSPRIMNYLGFE